MVLTKYETISDSTLREIGINADSGCCIGRFKVNGKYHVVQEDGSIYEQIDYDPDEYYWVKAKLVGKLCYTTSTSVCSDKNINAQFAHAVSSRECLTHWLRHTAYFLISGECMECNRREKDVLLALKDQVVGDDIIKAIDGKIDKC